MSKQTTIWIDEFMKENWKGDIISSPFIDTEYNQMMRAQTRLEGFEKVLGRKFTCYDCNHQEKRCCTIFSLEYRDLHPMKGIEAKGCEGFYLSDETKMLIKLKDREIEATKIDTHPRHLIREEMMYYIPEDPITTLLKEFNPKKNIPIRQALIKLELIL